MDNYNWIQQLGISSDVVTIPTYSHSCYPEGEILRFISNKGSGYAVLVEKDLFVMKIKPVNWFGRILIKLGWL